jgi:hypothetical protein
MVGARGLEPATPTCRIVVPEGIVNYLAAVACRRRPMTRRPRRARRNVATLPFQGDHRGARITVVSGRERLVLPKDEPSACQPPQFLDKRHKRDTRWRRDSDSATRAARRGAWPIRVSAPGAGRHSHLRLHLRHRCRRPLLRRRRSPRPPGPCRQARHIRRPIPPGRLPPTRAYLHSQCPVPAPGRAAASRCCVVL